MIQKHWTIVTPSEFEHERRALDFVRAGLPDHDPYRAWANFEFQNSDGALYEVDLLVLGKGGFWLVEIKSRPGRLEGDFGTWTWTTPDGRRLTDDNPIHLANKKSKALAGVLRPHVPRGVRLPFLEPLVFLSDPDLDFRLTGSAANHVCLTDRPADDARGPRDGVIAALTSRAVPGARPLTDAIDAKVARAVTQAMDRVGIRPSQKERRVGDYLLGELLLDVENCFQDRVARHATLKNRVCRARQYLVARAATEDQRRRVRAAAEREARTLDGGYVVVSFTPGTVPVTVFGGDTSVGIWEADDGTERGVILKGNRLDVDVGDRVVVAGILRVIDHPPEAAGDEQLPG